MPQSVSAASGTSSPASTEVKPLVGADDYCAVARRYHRLFYSAAFRILHNHEEAEDAIQEAHMRALAHLHQFSGRSALSTWVMQIAINEALTRLRKRVPVADLDGVRMKSTARDPEQEALQGQLGKLILAAVDALPHPQRTVFVLREVCDFDSAETAAQLGLTVQCVKTRLYRAKSLLRKRLRRDLSDIRHVRKAALSGKNSGEGLAASCACGAGWQPAADCQSASPNSRLRF